MPHCNSTRVHIGSGDEWSLLDVFARNSFFETCVPVCDVLCYYSGLCTNQCKVGRRWWEKQMKTCKEIWRSGQPGMILREYWILVGMLSF